MKAYTETEHASFKHAKGKVDIYERMFHSCYEIYLLLRGEVEFISDCERRRLMPMQLVVIPPGEYHRFVALGDIGTYERCVLNVGEGLLGAGAVKRALSGKTVLTLSENHHTVRNFLHLAASIQEMRAEDLAALLSAVATDTVLSISYAKQEESLSEALSPVALELMEYLNAHYTEHLELSLLSAEFHRSVSSLSHLFRESFGISIKKYVLKKRLHAADAALKRGEGAERVSAAYGFSDYSAFYRAYRSLFGVAPSQGRTSGDR